MVEISFFRLPFTTAIVGQRFLYGNAPPPAVLVDDEELEQALALAEE